MACGIYSLCENKENMRIIEPMKIKFARSATDLFAVIYPEVERIFTLKFEDRCIQKWVVDQYIWELDNIERYVMEIIENFGTLVCEDTEVVRDYVHFAVRLAGDLVQNRLGFLPIQLKTIIKGYADSCIILENKQ
jgi:hypothetical protein